MGLLSTILLDQYKQSQARGRAEEAEGLLGQLPTQREIMPVGDRMSVQVGAQSPGSGFFGSDQGPEAQAQLQAGLLGAGYQPGEAAQIVSPIRERGEIQRQSMLDMQKAQKEMTEQSFKQGNVLRKERGDELRPFVEAKTQYNSTMNSLKQGNAASTLAAVFSFMKTLDPRSVVREGEFQMGSSTGGVVDSLVGMVNRAKGEGMGAQARKNIAETIQAIMEGRVADAESIAQNYENIAQEQGVPVSQITTGGFNPELQGVPESFTVSEGGVQYEYRTDPVTGKQQRRRK
jgi:hypothetical protein